MTRQRAAREPFVVQDEPGGFLAGIGEIVAAHPSIAGGTAAFAVIFGFISANALWYQPGRHPAPILKTREVEAAPVAGAAEPVDAIREAIESVPTRRVTTYRIERGEETATGSIPVPDGQTVSSVSPSAAARAPAMPAPDPLLAAIQKELKRKGFYGGEVDGLIGPMSVNAIRNWERKAGLAVTGAPSEAVLDSLKHGGTREPLVARPEPRPTPKPAVARKQEKPAQVAVAAPAPAAAPSAAPAAAPASAGGDDLVRRIQSGLSNIAYADIAVDGVVGEQTRRAIRAFEKHYRLPETGEPNERVLKKLLEIGAL